MRHPRLYVVRMARDNLDKYIMACKIAGTDVPYLVQAAFDDLDREISDVSTAPNTKYRRKPTT